jgi:membrane protein implicated in regulation of membrane protease activity
MQEWFAAHNGLEQMFLLCAVIGGTIVLLRLVLTVAGLDHQDGALDGAHADSDTGFQLLSIQGISSFFTLFGLVGYTLYRQAHMGVGISLAVAVLAGVAAVWLMQRIFVSMLKLQSSGSVNLGSAVGCEGTVYVTVTGAGGSVQIRVANRLREFDAISGDGRELPSGTPIRVEKLAASKLVVTRIG